MLEFQVECLQSSWAFNRNCDNIEERYTQADLLRLAELDNESEAAQLCRRIAWAIWDVYRTINDYPDVGKVLERVRRPGLKPVVITTNYDFVVEAAAANATLGTYFSPGFGLVGTSRPNWLAQNLAATPPASGYFSLIKLHGSANWFYIGKELTDMACIPVGKCVAEGIAAPGFITQHVYAVPQKSGAIRGESSPAFIPPMLGKMSVAPVIALQWKAAIDGLANAKEVWVVGYSFPVTDTFMKRLLAEGIKKTATSAGSGSPTCRRARNGKHALRTCLIR
jgi:hypothetical protein